MASSLMSLSNLYPQFGFTLSFVIKASANTTCYPVAARYSVDGFCW
ncbi:hypothetical protein SEHO0A_00285 [Salmonella enterica subsp. houtenae str. ATCC BAA-1581]|nr:hypothetical protein SEHO0A_00285 [Salmonella enterica subsp. houtenae str. ATCC BAA-1581]